MTTRDGGFHATCFACGPSNDQGLRLAFTAEQSGSTCTVAVPRRFQGYAGIVHGGIVATLVDAAMVHTLWMASGKDPVTCRLEIHFLQPLPAAELLTVRAHQTGKKGKVMLAAAEVLCSGVCYARARGAFVFNSRFHKGGSPP